MVFHKARTRLPLWWECCPFLQRLWWSCWKRWATQVCPVCQSCTLMWLRESGRPWGMGCQFPWGSGRGTDVHWYIKHNICILKALAWGKLPYVPLPWVPYSLLYCQVTLLGGHNIPHESSSSMAAGGRRGYSQQEDFRPERQPSELPHIESSAILELI